MVPAKETAEEQLLHMIEGPSGPRSPSRRPWWMSWVERLTAWLRGGAAALWQGMLPSRQHRDRSDVFLWRLRLVNRLFAVVLLGLGGYLVVDLVMLRPEPPTLMSQVVPVGEPVVGQTEAIEAGGLIRPLDDYQQALKRRNPFRLATSQVIQETSGGKAPEITLEQKVSSLTVVGINRGQVPEALIEDTAVHRTHFVKIGEQVNGLTVEAIDEQGVIVSYDGESTYIP